MEQRKRSDEGQMNEDIKVQNLKDLRDGFIRQRRNLIVISLILLFAETSNLSLTKINLFGNELLIPSPVTVNYALWVAFLYWLLRYWQYYRHVDGSDQFRKAYKGRLNMAFEECFRRKEESADPSVFAISSFNLRHRSMKRIDVQYLKHIVVKENPRQTTQAEVKDSLTFFHLVMPRIRSMIYIIVNTRLATEYILPFVIALLPVGYKIGELIKML
jgi:hypothetical protein